MGHSWNQTWLIREKIYGLLAQCLLEPVNRNNSEVLKQDFWLQFPIEPANEQMESGMRGLVNTVVSLEGLSEEERIEEVAVDYTSLFVGPGRPAAPPWESLYTTKEGLLFGPTSFQMRNLLLKYGMESRNKGDFPEDHMGLQLMLLSVVSNHLQRLDELGQISTIKEQMTFIDEHLLSWIHEICKDAKANERTGFYGSLLELIWGILKWDKELLNEFVEKSESEKVPSC